MARLILPQGTPTERTLEVVEHLANVAWKLNEHFSAEPGADVIQRVMTIVGTQSARNPEVGGHVGEVVVELMPVERREVSSTTIIAQWRELGGDIPEAVSLTYGTREVGPGGSPIEVQLIGQEFADLRQVADRLKAELATYPGCLICRTIFVPERWECAWRSSRKPAS